MYTLMIVEDEPMEREALRRIVAKEFKDQIKLVEDAKNGIEAVIKAQQNKPDIILMDIGLPGKNGIEVQQEIISFLPNVQTIILSAYSDFDYAQKAVKLKVKDYLLKPLKTVNLKSSINKIILDLVDISKNEYQFDLKESESDIIKKSISYMNDNFKDKIDLKSISNYIHLNAQYFSRVFKKEVGISCIDYLNQLRINHSCKMLCSTAYPVYRIAIESGFTDASYFSRVFTRHLEDTPIEYRRKNSYSTNNKSSYSDKKTLTIREEYISEPFKKFMQA
jgi:two-component system, response regulator YesN